MGPPPPAAEVGQKPATPVPSALRLVPSQAVGPSGAAAVASLGALDLQTPPLCSTGMGHPRPQTHGAPSPPPPASGLHGEPPLGGPGVSGLGLPLQKRPRLPTGVSGPHTRAVLGAVPPGPTVSAQAPGLRDRKRRTKPQPDGGIGLLHGRGGRIRAPSTEGQLWSVVPVTRGNGRLLLSQGSARPSEAREANERKAHGGL